MTTSSPYPRARGMNSLIATRSGGGRSCFELPRVIDPRSVVLVLGVDDLTRFVDRVTATASAQPLPVHRPGHRSHEPPAAVLAVGIRATTSTLRARRDFVHCSESGAERLPPRTLPRSPLSRDLTVASTFAYLRYCVRSQPSLVTSNVGRSGRAMPGGSGPTACGRMLISPLVV